MTGPVRDPSDVAWPVATAARDHMKARLHHAIGGPPAVCCIVPGRDVAADDCCIGQAWVRVARTFRTTVDDFPSPTQSTLDETCAGSGWWAVELGLGTIRCAPTVDDHGNPPTAAELEHAARIEADDRGRLHHTVLCGLASVAADLWIGDWLPVGPSGGCVGGELTTIVLVETPCACPDHTTNPGEVP